MLKNYEIAITSQTGANIHHTAVGRGQNGIACRTADV